MFPGIFSTDIYGYIFYSRIMSVHGENPLLHAPSHFPSDPFLSYVYWRDVPAVYGPPWLVLASALTRLGTDQVVVQLLLFRAVALVTHLLISLVVWGTLSKLGREHRLAVTLLYAWNPLAIIEFAIGGHNIGLAILFIVLAVYLYTHSRGWWGWAALVMAALTRVTMALLWLPFLSLLIWHRDGVRSKALVLGWSLAVAAGVSAIMFLPFWHGLDTLQPWLITAKTMENSLLELLTPIFVGLAQHSGLALFEAWDPKAPHLSRAVIGLAFLLWWIRASWISRSVHATLQTWCWGLFFYFVLVSPFFWPWYAIVGLAVGALSWPSRAARASIALSFAGSLFYALWPTPPEPLAGLFQWRAVYIFTIPLAFVALDHLLGRIPGPSRKAIGEQISGMDLKPMIAAASIVSLLVTTVTIMGPVIAQPRLSLIYQTKSRISQGEEQRSPAGSQPSEQSGPIEGELPEPEEPTPTGNESKVLELDPRFGAIQISELGPEAVDVADDLGLAWSRELFYWDSLQAGLDLQRLQYTNRYIDLKTEVVGVIQFAPEYANRGKGGLYPPDNLNLAWDNPQNYWGSFMRALAADKRGKVDKWIVWNEPDICQDWMDGFAWRGSVEDYYRLLKVAYNAIKSANPDGQVIFGSLGIVHQNCRIDSTETTFFNRWLQVASQDPEAKANNWYFDAMSLNVHKEPERIQEMVGRYKALMRRYGFVKPIWLMEMSVLVHDGPIDPYKNFGLYATKEEQMSFLIQAIANAIVAGAEQIGIYKMANFPPSDPAYYTLKTAIAYMSGVERAEKIPNIYGAQAYRYSGVVRIVMEGPGFRTTVVYNRSPQPASTDIPALSESAILADKYGNEKPIEAVDGTYHLELEGATALYKAPWGQDIYFIGGSPLLLWEAKEP